MFKLNKKAAILLILLVGFMISLFAQTVYGEYGEHNDYRENEIVLRGKVTGVQDEESESDYIMLEQRLEVEVTSGEYQGEVFTVKNTLMDHYYDFYLEEGQEILLLAELEDGLIGNVYFKEVVRDKYIYYFIGIFIFLLLLVGGKKGLKTIIALGFTGFIIIKMLLPMILQGYNPILTSVVLASATAIFTLLIIGGLEKKTIAAIVGTIFGVLTAGLLALWIGDLAHLTGFSSEEAQMLMYMDNVEIDVRGILFAGIIIGSLGAVTDVGISIASAVSEVVKVNPRIDSYSLLVSGINVGRDIMGTMANTLILAYVGSATPLLLLITGYEMPWIKVSNLDLIATEIVRSVAGSIGLVITIPVTAIVAAWLFKTGSSR